MRAVTLTQNGRLILFNVLGDQSNRIIDDFKNQIDKLQPKIFGSYDLLINFSVPSVCEETINQVIKALNVLPHRRIAIWSSCALNLRSIKALSPDSIKIFLSEAKALQWVNQGTINSTVSKLAAVSGKNSIY